MENTNRTASGVMTVMLVLSVIAGVLGVFTLSGATIGVGLLAVAVLLAVFARIAQAGRHHEEVRAALAGMRRDPLEQVV